jgi:hypothetical protein
MKRMFIQTASRGKFIFTSMASAPFRDCIGLASESAKTYHKSVPMRVKAGKGMPVPWICVMPCDCRKMKVPAATSGGRKAHA